MSDAGDPYFYPGSNVLQNRLGIRNAATLDSVERELVVQRISEGAPAGQFDLSHLRSIHQHLFQDIYEWAGALRTVELAKAGGQFMHRRFIESGMADVLRRIEAQDYLAGLDPHQFAHAAGEILGDVNYVHPFREGNGRAQLLYLQQLARQVGHQFSLERLGSGKWIEASRAAQQGDYGPMHHEIELALVGVI